MLGTHLAHQAVVAIRIHAALPGPAVTLLGHEDISTTSNVYGDVGMDAKRRIQHRLVEFVKQQAADESAKRTAWQQAHPLPFSSLTWLLFDPDSFCGFAGSLRKDGSSGRTRNCLQALNKELSGHGWQVLVLLSAW